VAFASRGGQALAHDPEQTDFPLGSTTQRYSARPDSPVRYVPIDPCAVPIVTLVVAGAADEAEAVAETVADGAAAVALEVELLPHAASNSATPTPAAKPPNRNPGCLRPAIASPCPTSLAFPPFRRVVSRDTGGGAILPGGSEAIARSGLRDRARQRRRRQLLPSR
jgi:hypothetical protein